MKKSKISIPNLILISKASGFFSRFWGV